ncbi:MAG TPA: hypothetical protein VIN06_19610 [Devosia sp.]
MHAKKFIGSVLLAAGLALPAQAQDINALVMVPEAPSSGAVVAGCFGANRQLFGYNFTMCLERRGTYRVTGRGVNCQGRLNWRTSGRDIFIDIHRQSCGGGKAWEAATIDCRGVGIVRGILDSIFGRAANPFVMVPDTPAVRSLSCTYHPTVRGVGRVNFTARRL